MKIRNEGVAPKVVRTQASSGMSMSLDELEKRLLYQFHDRRLVIRALTHPSFKNEPGSTDAEDNQTLEFLGDSILGFLVAELLLRQFPERDEGFLSKVRSQLVGAKHLTRLARQLRLGPLVRLSSGEARAGGPEKTSVLSDALEALIAASYLDGGIDAARAIVTELFEAEIAAIDPSAIGGMDEKSTLQERSQADGLGLPEYELVSMEGPDHSRTFTYEVTYPDGRTARGTGPSKKEAQRLAAQALLEQLD
jgi:ribonuclease-3